MSELNNNIDPAVQQHRIAICVACTEINSDPVPHCDDCGKSISQLTSEQQEVCPLNKWGS